MKPWPLTTFCTCLLLSFSATRAQNPGGIGTSNLMFWLRGDAGISRSGSTFTWADQSGQGRNSVQSTALDTPTVTTATTDFMNYNPGIKIVANQWLIMANGLNNAGTTANEIFLVYKELTGAPDGMVLGTEVPGNRSYFYGSGVVQYGNSNKPATIPSYVANAPDIFVGKFFSSTDAAQAANGSVFSALAPASAPAAFSTPVAVGIQPNNSGGYNAFGYSGNVMELVGYNAEIDLTGTGRQQVESYLAIKYGITLDSVGTGGYYYNSSGTAVYKGGGGAGYFNNIIGIARDDNESLYQRQSHLTSDSVRLYMGSAPLTTTTNQANTATFASNQSYVVMGDNQGNLCQLGSNIGARPVAVDQRLDREWQITYNTTANVFNMDITLAACAPFSSGTGNPAALELLYSTTSANLTNGTIMANNTNGMIISLSSGGVVTIAGLNSALAAMAPAVPAGTTIHFTLASNQYMVLPLQLTNFMAKPERATKSVQLTWTTTDETGLSYFQVMRSSDGTNWQPIGQVDASGNTTGPDNYQFTDALPLSGTNDYRLLMVDRDGSSSWSSIVEVGFLPGLSSSISLFPNPATNQVFLQCPGQLLTASTVRLYSAAGDVLPFTITGGTGTATLYTGGLVPGIYFLQVKTPSRWQAIRLLRN